MCVGGEKNVKMLQMFTSKRRDDGGRQIDDTNQAKSLAINFIDSLISSLKLIFCEASQHQLV